MLELKLTIESLEALDNDANFIMIFLSQPEKHFHVVETTLKGTISKLFDTNKPMSELYQKYDSVVNLLNDKWWDHPYALHDHHFHKSFESFCNCPFTCLTEIIDVMNKVAKGN